LLANPHHVWWLTYVNVSFVCKLKPGLHAYYFK
jgi:hypothetical protein